VTNGRGGPDGPDGRDGSFAAGLVGITLDGRYRLDAVLGEGGMGTVFRATHLAMERKVAVKLLKPHLTNDHAQTQRFLREARSTFKVESPHAVKVLDFGVTPHRDYYMALEYLDGRTVQRELDVDGPFTPRRTVHIARQALHALGAAHRSGLVHRDIKPDNLLLMRVGVDSDYTKVLDFGVAKLMEGAAKSDQSQLALTAVGMVFGTPEFMSPEQACGHALDARSDLYSLAATMFVMMTGMGLFEGNSPIEWLMHHARTPPPSLAMVRGQLAAYPELDDLLQRCLAKHRDDRPANAAELDRLLAALEPTLERVPGVRPSAPPSTAVTTAPFASSAFSRSSYFHALPAQVIPGAPRESAPVPGRTAASTASLPGERIAEAATTTGVLREVRAPRRGRWLALGAIAVVAMIGAAIGVAARRAGTPTSRGAATTDAAQVAIVPDAPITIDAPPAIAELTPPGDASIPDAPRPLVRVRTDAASGRPVPTRDPIAEQHLANADAAWRAGNVLRTMAEADLALRADPKNARAKRLLGEALVKAGDTARGCKYLREIRRSHSACPDD